MSTIEIDKLSLDISDVLETFHGWPCSEPEAFSLSEFNREQFPRLRSSCHDHNCFVWMVYKHWEVDMTYIYILYYNNDLIIMTFTDPPMSSQSYNKPCDLAEL